jgi:hypothetical protein
MKKLIPSLLLASATANAFAATSKVTDPASSDRCHAKLEEFNASTGKFEAVDGGAVLLDGNESTGLRFDSGKHQFLLSFAKGQLIDRLSILGSGNAKFSVSLGNEKIAPGAGWETVLKNVKLAAKWGTEQPVNRTARYLLIETDSPTAFGLADLAIYGALSPVAVKGPRYLSELWEQRRSQPPVEKTEKLEPVYSGPVSSRFFPGKIGFPPRVNDAGVINRMRVTPTPSAPKGRLGTPPSPATR